MQGVGLKRFPYGGRLVVNFTTEAGGSINYSASYQALYSVIVFCGNSIRRDGVARFE